MSHRLKLDPLATTYKANIAFDTMATIIEEAGGNNNDLIFMLGLINSLVARNIVQWEIENGNKIAALDILREVKRIAVLNLPQMDKIR